MTTVQEIVREIELGIFYEKNLGTNELGNLLKAWKNEIIDECANCLVDDDTIQFGWLHQNILKIKEQL